MKESAEPTSFQDHLKNFLEKIDQVEIGSGVKGEFKRQLESTLPSIVSGLEVSIGLGSGRAAAVPSISFLGFGQTTTEGIYPVYLLYRKQKRLILAYGISSTRTPSATWKISDAETIGEYFERTMQLQVQEYSNSFVFRAYDLSTLDKENINRDLSQLIAIFKLAMATSQEKKIDFDLNAFTGDLRSACLQFSDDLVLRFVSALLAKRFVILTGLTGSGKTKLATTFTKWLTGNTKYLFSKVRFRKGEVLQASKVSYHVENVDEFSVTFKQPETGTKVSLPFELIDEWIESIKENGFTIKTSPREIRDAVEKKTKFSSQQNSFETHLKTAAFYLLQQKASHSKPVQVKIIPVGADWTNRDPLLGYPNALKEEEYVLPDNGVLNLLLDAIAHPTIPFFLILDEMNLSHVERYFADFLSAMESGSEIPLHSFRAPKNEPIRNSIGIPKNFFIIGTVNIDETTYMFSPKVLDRAHVIEFRIERREMENFLLRGKTFEGDRIDTKGAPMQSHFVKLSGKLESHSSSQNDISSELLSFFEVLQQVGAEFGYRSASEVLRFAFMVSELDPNKSTKWIIDAAIMQKLLPKLHGSRRKLAEPLETLSTLCRNGGEEKLEAIIQEKDKAKYSKFIEDSKYPISFEKICRMYKNLLSNGFTSYAEA